MFRLLGKKVELIRYIVHWQAEGRDMKEKCVSKEHRNAVEQGLIEQNIEFTTEAIDQTENEWFNGLEFNSYDEALQISLFTLIKYFQRFIIRIKL